MLKRLTLLLFLLSAFLWTFCSLFGNALFRNPEKMKKGLIISKTLWVSEQKMNFGDIHRPAPPSLEHRFKIKNISRGNVALKVKAKSCVCSVVEISNQYLAPEEETDLLVKWDIPNKAGPISFAVFVQTDSVAKGGIAFEGRVNLVDRYLIQPPEIQFGDVLYGETKTRFLTIQAPPGKALERDLHLSLGEAEGTNNLSLTVEKATKHFLNVKLSMTGNEEAGKKEYTLHLTRKMTTQPVIEIPVRARCLAKYRTQPDILVFKDSSPNTVLTQWTQLLGPGGQAPKIKNILVDNPDLLTAEYRIVEGYLEIGMTPRASNERGEQNTGIVEVYLEGYKTPVNVHYLFLRSEQK